MSDLVFRRLPWNLFVAAAVFAGAGFFLLYHLLVGALQDLSIWQGHWWQYLLAYSFLALGAAAVLLSRVECVTFSKSLGTVQITHYLPLWAYSQETHPLKDIEDVCIHEKGHFTRFENSLRYYVSLQFTSGSRIKTLETHSLRSVRAKVTAIRSYLRLSGDPILFRYR